MAETTTRKLLIEFGVQRAQMQQTLAAMQRLDTSFKEIRGEAGQFSRTIRNIEDASKGLKRALAIDDVTRQFAKMGQGVRDANTALQQMRAALKDIGASEDEIRRATQQFGVLSKAAREGGAPGARGGGGAGFEIGQRAIQAGAGIGGLSGVANDVLDIANSFASLNPALIAGTVATAGLGIAINALNQAFAEGKKRIDDEIAARRQIAEAVTGGQTTEAAARSMGELIEKQQIIADQLAFLKERYGDVGSAGHRLNVSMAPISAKFDELQKELITNQLAIDEYGRALGKNAFAANDAKKAAEEQAEAQKKAADEARRLAEQEKRLAEQRQVQGAQRGIQLTLEMQRLQREGSVKDIEDRKKRLAEEIRLTEATLTELSGNDAATETFTNHLRELKNELTGLNDINLAQVRDREASQQRLQAISDLASAQQQLAALENNRAGELEAFAREESRRGQIEALERDILAARERERVAEQETKITDLRTEARRKETDETRKYAADAAKVNADFLSEQLKRFEQFRLNETRATEDYNRERARSLEDLNRELVDLAAEGDVAGFIGRRRSGLTDIRRRGEDFATEGQRRLEDFQRENSEAEQQRIQRLNDLRAAFLAEQALRQAEQALRQVELTTRIAQERQAATVRVQDSARLEKALQELRARFAEEDRRRLYAERERAYRDQLVQLQTFANRARSILQLLVASTNIIPTGAGRVINARGQAITANATGGLYSQPTLSILGEKKGITDAVFPVRQGEGIDRALTRAFAGAGAAGGLTVYVTGNNIGRVVSEEQLEDMGINILKMVTSAVKAASA